jgi:hypothetical protein
MHTNCSVSQVHVPKMLSASPKSSRKRLYGDFVAAEKPKWNPRGNSLNFHFSRPICLPCWLVWGLMRIGRSTQMPRRWGLWRRRCTWRQCRRLNWFAGTTSSGVSLSSARRASSRRRLVVSMSAGALAQGRHYLLTRSRIVWCAGGMRYAMIVPHAPYLSVPGAFYVDFLCVNHAWMQTPDALTINCTNLANTSDIFGKVITATQL